MLQVKQPIPQPNTEERETPAALLPATNMARFLLTYDHSKVKAGGMARFHSHSAEGVRFGSGKVALDFENGNNAGYSSVDQMVTALARQGNYRIDWID